MPEGPEVKLSADLIRPLVVGKKIKIAYSTDNSRYGDSKKATSMLGEHYSMLGEHYKSLCLQGADVWINSVSTRGKFMYWKLSLDENTDTPGWVMFSTFGMTGQWSPTKGKHPCFVFEFTDRTQMVFNDPRHFGTIKFYHISELQKKLDELGWDPLSMPLDKNLKWVTQQLSRTSKSVAEVLMDQTVFSGVGNYIRAEALYLSKLSPWRDSNKLTPDQIETLCKSIVSVMESSYQHQGATIQTYKTAYGEEGRYSTLFQVYGRKEDPMGRKIVKQQTPDKRSIHWCPEVQV
jgi:formamidopyrimidine-DNA glycosylase